MDRQIEPDDRARWISDYVDALELSELEDTYRGVGSKAYPPRLMLKLAIYESMRGSLSPAAWSQDVKKDITLQWLGMGIRPSRSVLYGFRDRLGGVIVAMHADLVRMAMREGLLSPKVGVLDGTAIRACASRHRIVNMEAVTRRREELQAVMLRDEAGQSVREIPGWMAKTLQGRREQCERFARAQTELNQRHERNAKRPSEKRLKESHICVSLSDPEAPIGRDKEKVYTPLYTVQCMVDKDSHVVLAYELFAQATDAGTLAPMLDETSQVIGYQLPEACVDAGYTSLADLEAAEQRSVDLYGPLHENSYSEKKQAEKQGTKKFDKTAFTWDSQQATYTCPAGHTMNYKDKRKRSRQSSNPVMEHRYQCSPVHCRNCPLNSRCVTNPENGRIVGRLEGEEKIEAHREKMKTAQAKAKMRLRGSVVERPFADSKHHRNLRRFHGRGINRARAEAGLVMLTQTFQAVRRLRAAANSDESGP